MFCTFSCSLNMTGTCHTNNRIAYASGTWTRVHVNDSKVTCLFLIVHCPDNWHVKISSVTRSMETRWPETRKPCLEREHVTISHVRQNMRLCMTRNQKTMLCSVCSANDNYMRTQDHHTMRQFNETQKGWHCGSTPYTISPHITLSKCQSMENEMFHDGFFVNFRVYHAKHEANAKTFLPTLQATWSRWIAATWCEKPRAP